MANEIIILKNRCEKAENELKALSASIVSLCEKTLSVCKRETDIFGELKNEKSKSDIIEHCVTFAKEINSFSNSALDQINIIYQSILKYSEYGSTPLYKRSGAKLSSDIFTYSYFFTLANEIGNVFEDIFEKDIPDASNEVLNGLDIDRDGAHLRMSIVISSIRKIANTVSKATKFYFNED